MNFFYVFSIFQFLDGLNVSRVCLGAYKAAAFIADNAMLHVVLLCSQEPTAPHIMIEDPQQYLDPLRVVKPDKR